MFVIKTKKGLRLQSGNIDTRQHAAMIQKVTALQMIVKEERRYFYGPIQHFGL